MAPKREQILWKGVWPVCEKLEKIFSLKAILSAGVLALSELELEEREAYIAEAHELSIDEPEEKIRKLKNLLNIVEASEYKILTKEEADLVNQIRRALTPEPENQMQKSKKG